MTDAFGTRNEIAVPPVSGLTKPTVTPAWLT
jgi:hypothetical protein